MVKEVASPSEKDLEAQIQELKKEISDITTTLREFGSDKINQTKGKAEKLYAAAKANGEEAVSQAKDKLNDIESQLTSCLQEKPVTSLAFAAGIGFLLALLVRR